MASTSTTTSAPTQRQTAIPLELLWVDCEVSDGSDRARELTIAQAGEKLIERSIQMSGLDLTKDVIIEFAAIVTDGDLNPLDEGVQWVVRTDKAILDGMDEWCTNQHGSSGLTKQCLESPHSLSEVDELALAYTRKHIPEGRVLLAGSSVHVCVFSPSERGPLENLLIEGSLPFSDKTFLKKDFPKLSSILHYRVLDVSSVKEICRRWYPNMDQIWKSSGESSHRALDDIQASIEELRRYRKHVFKDVNAITSTNDETGLEGTAAASLEKLKL